MKMTKVLMSVCAMALFLGISGAARANLISVGTGYGSHVGFTTPSASTLYVSPDGLCGGKTPCYTSIQHAIDEATTGGVIFIAQGTSPFKVVLLLFSLRKYSCS